MSTRILLVRHAEVEARYQGVFGGRIDMNLSPRGHEQALALADYLHQARPDAIYASPMKRVQQTLAPLMGNGVPAPIILGDMREVDFGDWTGLNWEEALAKYRIRAFEWLEHIERGAVPNGESGPALRARVEPCLRQIIRDHAGQNVAVICHGGVIRAALAVLLELPFPRTAAFEIDYASITTVEVEDGRAWLQSLNYQPWHNGIP
ncbi:MAG TPA: histidine phosphatase family protein [Verrucomicrobiae bacterium]|nr:histidine phosphatase family protein [Verrucomicrobiae bacterium]